MFQKTMVGLTDDLITWLDAIAKGRGGVSRSEVIRDILEDRRSEGAKQTELITDEEIIHTLEALRIRIKDRATELALRRAEKEERKWQTSLDAPPH